MDIKLVGIVGSGQMGAGIAQVCAQAKYDVLIYNRSAIGLKTAFARIEKSLNRLIENEVITGDDARNTLARLQPAGSLSDLSECDLIIESIVEDEHMKKVVFEALCEHLKPNAVLASNTSSISITRLASMTDRPEKFIGLHFMNPVPSMKLVEVIRGIATNSTTYELALEFAHTLGKIASNAEDFPGFIVNRILIPMINEAVYALYEGIGSVEAIDTAIKLGANHPMGPLQLADFIGLDTLLSIMNVLHSGFGDSKYRPCPLLIKYVEAGWLGKKSKRGFYDYRGLSPVSSR